MTHDDCKSFAWPSYKCQCGDPEEDYIEIEDIVKDENVLSGRMPLMQTILIAIGIAIIFVTTNNIITNQKPILPTLFL